MIIRAVNAKAEAALLNAADRDRLESSTLERTATVTSGFASQGLLIQLRSHHPTGCLLSELVQVVDGQYVVRATVEVDGASIASAMSAATTIEVAEDQARSRVLAIIGLTPLPLRELKPAATRIPDVAPEVVAETVLASSEPAAEPDSAAPTVSKAKAKATKSKAKAATKSTNAKVSVPAPPAPVVEMPVAEAAVEPAVEPSVEITGGDDGSDELELEYEFTIDGEPLDPSTIGDDLPPAEPTIDLSDAIAQIGTEIERIGWTKKQGSAYLQETYGKRTRAELTETELLDFLHYLKALPSKVQPVLSDLPF